MTHYLLSVHTASGDRPAEPSDANMGEYAARIDALETEMRAANALVFSGRLADPDSAAVVDATNGEVQTTDGPYLESKEAIGGFYIIEAASPDAAHQWASRTSAVVGMPIELRPFQGARQG
jgi:hypothetical protein